MIQKPLHAALIVFIAFSPGKPLCGQDALMETLDKEMLKITEEYGKKEHPPYFIDMRVHDIKSSLLQYSSGILISQHQSHDRIVTSGMRIGNYKVDNTSIPEDAGIASSRIPVFAGKLPFENDSLAICHCLERGFEKAYEQSLQQYKTYLKSKSLSDKKDDIPAFSVEQPSVFYEEPVGFKFDEKSFITWKEVLRHVSETVSNDTDIVTSDIALMVMDERIYYLSSEGSRIIQNRPQCQIQMIVAIKTRDGNLAPMTKSYIGPDIASLPTPEKLEADVQELRQLLKDLKDAPLADPYAGPAMLSPQAAGVFFHEIFGHRIEGQRLNNAFDSHTFKDKIGKKIINESITIVSDPTQTDYKGIPLFGSYLYDDEGIPARAVTVVEKGILKTFLMSRIPVMGQLQSNGHGRAQIGSAPYSRQANLFIKSATGISESAMRKKLLKECRKQGKAYGYYVKEVFGGFTSTDLFSPQVFNIIPTVVYRIYEDGRPDELVRGVTFIGTPLTVFSELMAASENYEVFNGFCGAESGNIPVSTISPGLLIKKLETQKTPEARVVSPKLPSPVTEK
ncbi:MAG: TldD/PmbA family protein [Bacteroidales bacterium]|nr:TldD/PmbA family protein [Bacteroidales bacterium]